MNMQPKSQSISGIASVEECDAFLATHPEVENVQIFFTNQSGVPRGKNCGVATLARCSRTRG
jgi:hypothetical protein